MCTKDRANLLSIITVGQGLAPAENRLTVYGRIAEEQIKALEMRYSTIKIDKYCIMPDHIHFIISINTDENGRTQFAPTISRVIKQFKGAITKQVGRPIWQKSYYDHGIRNQQDYNEIWQYIENNPLKYLLKNAP